jgi:glucokinase
MEQPVIGVDLGATNIRAAAVEAFGRCGDIVKRRVPESHAPQDVVAAVAEACREVSGERSPRAVGVGLAGWLEESTGFVQNSPNLGWRDVPFGELLRAELESATVAVTNDLRAIAWGEYLFGGGAGAETLLVVFQGSGVGSSVILGGTPLRGVSGIACEIGHVRVVPTGGRACGCGQRGCLEAYAGGHNLERRARHDLETGVDTSLRELVGVAPMSLTCAAIENAAADGDHYSLSLWREAAGYLGQVVGSVVTFINPDRLILGGGVWSGAPTLRELTLERFEHRVSPGARARCTLAEPTLGDTAGMLGAAAMARGLDS